MEEKNIEGVAKALKIKGNLKQSVYQTTLKHFNDLKDILNHYSDNLQELCKDDLFEVNYRENGKFEAEIKFSGDLLIFNMHSNVFSFQDDYFINDTPYVKQDESRKYCGMIEIYNFLADSLKYSRLYDVGYLIARIFINKEGHFFIEGEEKLGFLYKDFSNLIMNKEFLSLIIEEAMLYSIDYDLWVPSYKDVRELTVGMKIQQTGSQTHKTGKRLGFNITNSSK